MLKSFDRLLCCPSFFDSRVGAGLQTELDALLPLIFRGLGAADIWGSKVKKGPPFLFVSFLRSWGVGLKGLDIYGDKIRSLWPCLLMISIMNLQVQSSFQVADNSSCTVPGLRV